MYLTDWLPFTRKSLFIFFPFLNAVLRVVLGGAVGVDASAARATHVQRAFHAMHPGHDLVGTTHLAHIRPGRHPRVVRENLPHQRHPVLALLLPQFRPLVEQRRGGVRLEHAFRAVKRPRQQAVGRRGPRREGLRARLVAQGPELVELLPAQLFFVGGVADLFSCACVCVSMYVCMCSVKQSG